MSWNTKPRFKIGSVWAGILALLAPFVLSRVFKWKWNVVMVSRFHMPPLDDNSAHDLIALAMLVGVAFTYPLWAVPRSVYERSKDQP